jgi:hypothetical protein
MTSREREARRGRWEGGRVNGGRERTEETSAPVKRVSGRVCTTQTSKGRERERDRRESRGGERRERGEGNCDGAKLGALLFFPGSLPSPAHKGSLSLCGSGRNVDESRVLIFFVASARLPPSLSRPDLLEAVFHVLRERLGLLARCEVPTLRGEEEANGEKREKGREKREKTHLRVIAVELKVAVARRPRLRSGADLLGEGREAKRLFEAVRQTGASNGVEEGRK